MNAPAAGTPPSLMERRKRDSREDIVRAAMELFRRDGFEATTVEAIAAAAGCSRRTFYHYFDSKQEVMFHDIPGVFDRLRQALDGHLADGAGLWAAVSESVVDLIGRFADDDRILVQRMELWLGEPALHARYMHYVEEGERTVVECLCRQRGTKPGSDDLAQTMANSAIGAYRATIATHSPRSDNRKLTKHLRELLALHGAGLDDSNRAQRLANQS